MRPISNQVRAARASASRRAIGPAACLPLLAVALAGCGLFSPLPTDRGISIEAVDYDKLVPGTTTKADVTNLIGSPTSHATFDDNTWIYIGEVTAPVPMARPRVEKQEVVVLAFDAGGTLRSRRLLDRADGRDIAMAAGKTPTPGSQTSFMQQLIGNVGRYNPLGAMGGGGLGSSGLGNSNNGYGHGGTGNTVGGGS
ncbi:outer membrane protein assembly factor BamE [Lichenicoccus roseus]|uniref:Outer membrane protein assembly factor BamE n=1 Tax=Lichenicoccus roseus TaxID=2683649 RepID=A0A5R9J4H3_9PROT|nr:outer membrane protein assembly factor BamE [Lichenicoccus roseus]TLU72514.1 outer membrane protein assembly factor BamE [Lichenicoccus roseus]